MPHPLCTYTLGCCMHVAKSLYPEYISFQIHGMVYSPLCGGEPEQADTHNIMSLMSDVIATSSQPSSYINIHLPFTVGFACWFTTLSWHIAGFVTNFKRPSSYKSHICQPFLLPGQLSCYTCMDSSVATYGLCFYRPSTAGRSQAVKIGTVVEVASGRASHTRQKSSS